MQTKPKVLLAMSGGVDSSVAGVLLLEQGYEVVGGFMKNWSEKDKAGSKQSAVGSGECSWRTERRDAMRVAAQLGIEFYTFDFEDQYRAQVYEYMIAEYKAGRTPNPDVLCNKYMKFGLFLEKAKELGCDYVATGHYARIKRSASPGPSSEELPRHPESWRDPAKGGRGDVNRFPPAMGPACRQGRGSRGASITHLLSGLDRDKDQSYFLCRLEENQLEKVLFPVGDLQKSEVRKIARENKLPVADKKDSQGICFVGKVALDDFLKDRIKPQEGNIIDLTGKILGKHQGHMYYTIGQRQGLGLAGGPWFIVERRPETNEIVVALEDDPSLFKSELTAVDITETIPGNLESRVGKLISARIRYRQGLQEGKVVRWSGGRVDVKFKNPQKAVAPGQFVAFYEGDELLGSGVIC